MGLSRYFCTWCKIRWCLKRAQTHRRRIWFQRGWILWRFADLKGLLENLGGWFAPQLWLAQVLWRFADLEGLLENLVGWFALLLWLAEALIPLLVLLFLACLLRKLPRFNSSIWKLSSWINHILLISLVSFEIPKSQDWLP